MFDKKGARSYSQRAYPEKYFFVLCFLPGPQPGGSALAIMAIRSLLSKGKTPESGSSPMKKVEGGFIMSSITTLFLTLANPMTILTFGAAFMGLGLAPDSPFHATLLALCVGLGSAIWHCGLVGVGGILRERLNAGALRTINKLSVVSILALSIWMIVS